MHKEEVEIQVPWGTVSGVGWGNSNDVKVLMVHGIQDNASSYDNLIPLLPKGFYYLCIDLPGHGKSSHYPKYVPLSVLTYIIGIKQITEEIKWNEFYYIGHSYGGHIGEYFAGCFPDAIIKMVVIDAMPFCYEEDQMVVQINKYQKLFLQLQKKVASGNPPVYTYQEALNRHIKYRPTKISAENAEKLLQRSLVKCDGGFQLSTDQRLKLDTNVFYTVKQNKSFIDKAKCPMLVIIAKETYNYNANDTKNLHIMFSSAKDYEIKIVEGNHNVHIDHPERIASIVSKFLTFQKSNL